MAVRYVERQCDGKDATESQAGTDEQHPLALQEATYRRTSQHDRQEYQPGDEAVNAN
ncbi:MAG TPA: hypothetical protein VI336_03650 [Candidatus Saccharimonadales bacterium]|nr:hypothetical protein [Candidatus Saccharimonadales bacterium]